jgi:hypothetical protein
MSTDFFSPSADARATSRPSCLSRAQTGRGRSILAFAIAGQLFGLPYVSDYSDHRAWKIPRRMEHRCAEATYRSHHVGSDGRLCRQSLENLATAATDAL